MGRNPTVLKIPLSSGREGQVLRIRNDIISNYYLVCFPREQGEPTPDEVTEMLIAGNKYAQDIAQEKLNDKDAYSLLYSGYSTRREKGWHVHIVLLGNRWAKARLYLILALKNLAQALGLRKDDAPKL